MRTLVPLFKFTVAAITLWCRVLLGASSQVQPSSQPASAGAIFAAIKSGDADRVKELVKFNAALIASRDASGWTPLHHAVSQEEPTFTVSITNLHLADVSGIREGEITKLVFGTLDNIVLISRSVRIGDGPITVSTKDFGKLRIELPFDLQHGGRLLPTPTRNEELLTKREAAHATVLFRLREQIAEWLLASGADVDAKDRDGQTPLHVAAAGRDEAAVRLLLAHHASVNAIANFYLTFRREAFSVTPLQIAAFHGNAGIVKLLLNSGAIVNINRADSPLALAAEQGNKDIVQLLLAHGAQVDGIKGVRIGQTPLILAAANDHEEIARLLLTKGADINFRTGDSSDWPQATPLVVAAESGSTGVLKLLLNAGADKDSKDQNAHYFYDRASGELNRGTLNFATTLIHAAKKGRAEVVSILLTAGADKDAKDYWGHTALAEGVIFNEREIVKLLLDKGADVNAVDKAGRTPLDWAVHERNDEMAKLLQEHGGKECGSKAPKER